MKPKTCNLDEHHGPQVGAADVQGGFYVEGINGVISNDRDLASGKRADDGTWEAGRYYPHGETTTSPCFWVTYGYCSTPELWDAAANTWLPGAGRTCTGGCPDGPMSTITHYVYAHTCAAIRFEYAPDSRSTVYELPNQEALDACDFSGAILRGDEAAGSPHFDILIDYDHEKKDYFYASWVGCMDGQKVRVRVTNDYKDGQCDGAGSSKIRHCDCNYAIRRGMLVVDPCHTNFVYSCLRDMPDDQSCCPDDATMAHMITEGAYVNTTGGTENTGTCIPKSDLADSLQMVPVLKDMQVSNPAQLAAFNVSMMPCSRGDALCSLHNSVTMCNVTSPPHECQYDPNWLAWTTWEPSSYDGSLPAPMSFRDDAGVMHAWTKAQPTIVAQAFDALTLMHMGMDPSQIIGVYGEQARDGSNMNGQYSFSNGAFGAHGDHADLPHDVANFPTNPTPEEQALLAQMHDLSPDCSSTNFWCAHFDHTILDANGWPDLIIEGPYHGANAWTDEFLAAASAKNIPIIRLTNSYSTESAPTRGFIEIAQRFEDLARALGVVDVTAAVAYDKADLCDEIEAFKPVALAAQLRGVRALAGYLPYGPASPNGNIGGWVATPDKDPVLMMLEELGMPIMHSDTTSGSYWENMGEASWQASDENGISATDLMSTGGRTGGRVKVPCEPPL